MCRFEQLGEIEDINDAITQHCEAIQQMPIPNPDVPMYRNNLGNSIARRFSQYLGETWKEEIDEAIQLHREAVQLAPSDSYDLPMFTTNLGHSCLSRFKRFKKMEDLDEAIEAQRESVQLTPSTVRTCQVTVLALRVPSS
jgi:hypothetical protein